MKSITSFFTIFFLFIISQGISQVAVKGLRCEYLKNPLGIDSENPRLTWILESGTSGSAVIMSRIVTGTDREEVSVGQGHIQTFGTVSSSGNLVKYAGPALEPFTRYYWSASVMDGSGEWSDWSSVAYFETGMMDQGNWKGQWITDTHDYNLKPAPYFRKEFTIEKDIESARVYIAVAGLYELYVNGERIGNHRLDPMYTRFDRRNLYVTHDVTDFLKRGKNVVGVLLGNGWYNHQSTAVWYFDKAPWRARPKFCLDMRVTGKDGTTEMITTGPDWQTSLSPVIFNSIYTAEHYDGRLEQPGWDKPGFEAEGWKSAVPTGAPSQNIVAQVLHPIRNVWEITAKKMTRLNNNTWLFDFGRNMAGVTRLVVSGPEGTVIKLKHTERLDNKGFADMSNIDVHYRPVDDSDPFQTDIFILGGQGEEEFMPRFNYKGFQYVEVTADKPLELTQESLTAYFMHSDVPPVGRIRSSNPVLDKTWEASNASYLSNLFGYPTDCPQREKNGWTGDAHISIETGLYNFDGITVYEKWLADHRDEQQPNGVLPAIIPSNGWGYHWANGPDWTSTIAIIPWNIYLFYGDSHLLELCYDNIKKYVDHINEISPAGLTDWGLGDWVPVKSVTPKEFTSTAYYYVDVVILAKAAKLFGRQDDFKKYTLLAEKIKKALNDKYFDSGKGIYGSGLQTELSVALHWGLVPEKYRAVVAENLANKVVADNKHLDVGLLGTKTLLNALSENGYPELAYEVASQETYPSWGWWIVNGATTFYENWPLDASRDISMNHIMFGEINAWYYKALGGIFPDEKQPGFKNVILKPDFVSGLKEFEAEHMGPFGKIISSWKRSSGSISYNVAIPPNSTATLYLPGDAAINESGRPLQENGFIRIKGSDNDKICLLLKSGRYNFSISD